MRGTARNLLINPLPKTIQNMTTIARPTTQLDSHWYYPDSRPCYELPKKDGSGVKVPTLADARKLNLLPSVTTVLKILDKPELTNWKIEQAVLAVLTTPRNEGEQLDAYIDRVLHVEKVQDQEAATARDQGTEIHAAMEDYFQGRELSEAIKPWVMPAALSLRPYGELVATEKILVGPGYAGKTDLILNTADCWWLWDFKAVKTLPPKWAWEEHVLQLAAYAKVWQSSVGSIKPVRTANLYISRVECGKFLICEHEPWQPASAAFDHLLAVWQFQKKYVP